MGVIVGRGTYGPIDFNPEGNDLVIGNFCSLAEGTHYDSGLSHNSKLVTTFPFNCFRPCAGHIKTHPVIKGPISIGHDVTIGMNSFIMSGVTIGSGAVIGAISFISKDVPPYAIVVGANRLVRYRFTPEQIADLLEIKWWDWPDEKIDANVELLMSEDINEFIKLHKV